LHRGFSPVTENEIGVKALAFKAELKAKANLTCHIYRQAKA